jgi:hypothetical protein
MLLQLVEHEALKCLVDVKGTGHPHTVDESLIDPESVGGFPVYEGCLFLVGPGHLYCCDFPDKE